MYKCLVGTFINIKKKEKTNNFTTQHKCIEFPGSMTKWYHVLLHKVQNNRFLCILAMGRWYRVYKCLNIKRISPFFLLLKIVSHLFSFGIIIQILFCLPWQELRINGYSYTYICKIFHCGANYYVYYDYYCHCVTRKM